MPSANKTSLVIKPEVRELLADLSEVMGLSQSAVVDVALVGLAQRIGLRTSAERRAVPGSAGAPGEPQVPRPRARKSRPK